MFYGHSARPWTAARRHCELYDHGGNSAREAVHTASAKIDLTPVDSTVSVVTLDLNNALNLGRVTDASGRQIPTSQSRNENKFSINFPEPLVKGTNYSITVDYEGKLTGNEESPVPGVKFAAIQSAYAYLMYPARWFPVNDYSADRFTMTLAVTVPSAMRVVASGFSTTDRNVPGKITYNYKFSNASFPGSIAVVEDAVDRVKLTNLPVELKPTNAFTRRLQHLLVERYQLTSESVGAEPQRRVRILPSVAP